MGESIHTGCRDTSWQRGVHREVLFPPRRRLGCVKVKLECTIDMEQTTCWPKRVTFKWLVFSQITFEHFASPVTTYVVGGTMNIPDWSHALRSSGWCGTVVVEQVTLLFLFP